MLYKQNFHISYFNYLYTYILYLYITYHYKQDSSIDL